MRRLIVLVLALCAVSTAFAVSVTPAQAIEESTCTIHSQPITNIDSTVPSFVFWSWDYKCGGANNMDYYAHMMLQVRHFGGPWHYADCDGNGAPSFCELFKPAKAENCLDAVGYPGFCSFTDSHFNGGDEHDGTSNLGIWDDTHMAGDSYRVQTDIVFRNGWHVYYYGQWVDV